MPIPALPDPKARADPAPPSTPGAPATRPVAPARIVMTPASARPFPRSVTIFLLQALLYLLAWLATLGILSLLGWWLRYAIAAIAAMLPILGILWFLWAWLVAIPMALLADGTAAEKRVVEISHWLNDRTSDLLWFVVLLPYKFFILVTDIANWLCT